MSVDPCCNRCIEWMKSCVGVGCVFVEACCKMHGWCVKCKAKGCSRFKGKVDADQTGK